MDLEELRDTVKKTREKALVEESAPVNLLPDDVCKRIGDFPEWDEFIETESKEAVRLFTRLNLSSNLQTTVL